MDSEASIIQTLLHVSDSSYTHQQSFSRRAKPPKPPSFTNWDEELQLSTYIHREADCSKLKPPLFLRRSAESRKRQGLLTTRTWKEDFPEIEKLLETRSRAVTHPLTKPNDGKKTDFTLSNPNLQLFKAVPGKEVLRDIVFPQSKPQFSPNLRSFRSTKALKLTENWRKQAEISFSRLELRSCRDFSENSAVFARKTGRFASALRWSPYRAMRKRGQQ